MLGRVDLDPCASGDGPITVPATTRSTEADDGLTREWARRVYMNPPYGRAIKAWVRKLLEEERAGRVTAAVALVPGGPGSEWWEALGDAADALCLSSGRLRFLTATGARGGAPFPSAVFFFGERTASATIHFAQVGQVWQRIA